MTTSIPPVCLGCTHFQGKTDDGPVCSAFPTGIPDDIWEGEDPHVVSRDGEVIYRPRNIAQLAFFVGRYVVPALNPSLAGPWGKIARRLLQAEANRAIERGE